MSNFPVGLVHHPLYQSDVDDVLGPLSTVTIIGAIPTPALPTPQSTISSNSTTTPAASSGKDTKQTNSSNNALNAQHIGLGLGIGLGIPLFVAVALAFIFYRQRRHALSPKDTETKADSAAVSSLSLSSWNSAVGTVELNATPTSYEVDSNAHYELFAPKPDVSLCELSSKS